MGRNRLQNHSEVGTNVVGLDNGHLSEKKLNILQTVNESRTKPVSSKQQLTWRGTKKCLKLVPKIRLRHTAGHIYRHVGRHATRYTCRHAGSHTARHTTRHIS